MSEPVNEVQDESLHEGANVDADEVGDAETEEELIPVEVAYGTPEKQRIIPLRISRGTTAFEAVIKSGITREFPGIDVNSDAMGIFSTPMDGKTLPLPGEYQLETKDRVEIYRPLIIDPKQARLARAEKRAARKASEESE